MSKVKMKIIIKTDPRKIKMSSEELQFYLRERKRGTGIHKNKKTDYNRQKEKIKTRDYSYE